MSYNIHHGEGVDGRIDLERIARVILDENVDVAMLQEVDRGVARSGRLDIPRELSVRTGMTFCFGKNINYGGGDYGNAILSRYSILEYTNTPLEMLRPGEQRGLLRAHIEIAHIPVCFWNTHLDYRSDDRERWQSIAQFERLVPTRPCKPLIFGGDFNAVPDSRVMRRMADLMEDAWTHAGNGAGPTYPSTRPRKRIDYLFYASHRRMKPLRAWRNPTNASDHLPLIVEFRLHTNTPRP